MLVAGNYRTLETFDKSISLGGCEVKLKECKSSLCIDVLEHELFVKLIFRSRDSLNFDELKSAMEKWISLVSDVREEVLVEGLPPCQTVVLGDGDDDGSEEIVCKVFKILSSAPSKFVLSGNFGKGLKPGNTFIVLNQYLVATFEVMSSGKVSLKFFPIRRCYVLLTQEDDERFDLTKELEPVFEVGTHLLSLPEDRKSDLKTKILISCL